MSNQAQAALLREDARHLMQQAWELQTLLDCYHEDYGSELPPAVAATVTTHKQLHERTIRAAAALRFHARALEATND